MQTLRDPIKLVIFGLAFNFIIKTWLNLGHLLFIRPLFEIMQTREIVLMPIFWMCYKFISLVEQHLLLGHLTEKYPDRAMVQTSSKFSRVMILIIGALIFFFRFNTTVITFFGGSALVFLSFIGKDVFPNYLSGFVIYVEDRFKLGDWIYSTDKQIEGTIESIDLRSTSIRTFDRRLLIVPNTLLISNVLCNASKMTNRRIRETIGIERVSREIVEKITQDIRVMIQNHPGIDQSARRMVHFIEFGTYSLNIELYIYTKTTDFQTYRNVQQDIFLKVMQIIEKNGARLAFPTHTLHMQKPLPIKKELQKIASK